MLGNIWLTFGCINVILLTIATAIGFTQSQESEKAHVLFSGLFMTIVTFLMGPIATIFLTVLMFSGKNKLPN